MRDRIASATKEAMKSQEKERLSTLRLISAAIKDKDIALRSENRMDGVTDEEILGILGKMIKQRGDSVTAYEEAGRLEQAEAEGREIRVIEEFLPKQLSDDEVASAVEKAIQDVGAASVRDMGRVMGALKAKYAGQMDFGKAGGAVKELLG